MKKNKVLIGSALALLIAPTVLSNLSPQSVSAATNDSVSGLVGTVRSGSGVLVNNQGQTITSTFLPTNSSWKLGASTQFNGITYYQVATNEWVAANSIEISRPTDQTGTLSSSPTQVAATSAAQVGTAKWASAVVNNQGQAITGVVLPAGSSWNIGITANINGTTHVQIATNEWVAASDLAIAESQPVTATTQASQEQQPLVGTVVNGPANLYDTSMDSFSGRQLQDGTDWKVGQMVQNKYGYTFYQVSNNEWAQSSHMQLNQENTASQVSSEPEFATSVTQ